MNIKRQMPKLMSVLLSFAMVFSGALPAYAMEAPAVENAVDEAGSNGSDSTTEEENLEEIEVTYKQSSSYFVTIPKTIALDSEKKAAYSVRVTGDIGADQCVYVAPIDGIPSTEDTDFYMKDQATENKKSDVVATVTQSKLHWSSEEVAKGYEETDNSVSAPDLTAGTWEGLFQMAIRLESHVAHVHDYKEEINKEPTCTEEGEKTYTCGCGDSYTEKIPAKGHHFEDGICTGCGEKDPDYHKHDYVETVTKEPTCTEEGEKTYTCECGESYTEKIPMTEHHYGDDDICTDCGQSNPNHIHDYKPYRLNVSPTNVQFKNSSYSKSDATAWHLTQSTAEYDEYACANFHNGYNRKGDLTLTCDLILPEEYEGTIDYPYYYNVNYTQNRTYKYCTVFYVNNSLLYKFTSYSDSTGAGSSRADKTTALSAGKNTFTARFVTYNNYSASDYYNKDKSSATVRLYKPVIYDGSDYHICDACGRKEEHRFLDGVCVECGWREEDHTHHYVDGVCDKCGKSETQYTLKIDYPDFLNEVESVTSNTQYIQDGDILALPEKTDDAFDLSGYSVARAVKDVLFCSSNMNNNDAIYVWNSGRSTYEMDKAAIEEFGLTAEEQISASKWRSEATDYSWEQTAVSDTIVIEKPSVYVFTVSEREKCDNTYDAGFQVGGSLTLQDVTNDKSYNLRSLAGSAEKTYDYDNVKIRCIKKTVNSTSSTGKYDRTYKSTYMIYLDPGQYKLSASGYAGNGQNMGGNSIYYMYLSSPLRSTSSLAAPVINDVKHAAFGGTLYELIPIENGQAFDYSTMYTNETSKDIYLISNWTAKTTE